jgi:hypothetical protein
MEIAIVMVILMMSLVVQRVWPDGSSHSNVRRSKPVKESRKIARTVEAQQNLNSVLQYKANIFSKSVFPNLSFVEDLLR